MIVSIGLVPCKKAQHVMPGFLILLASRIPFNPSLGNPAVAVGDYAIDLVGEIVIGKGSNAEEGGSGDVWLRREAFEGEPIKR
jgi:hypothetical protein